MVDVVEVLKYSAVLATGVGATAAAFLKYGRHAPQRANGTMTTAAAKAMQAEGEAKRLQEKLDEREQGEVRESLSELLTQMRIQSGAMQSAAGAMDNVATSTALVAQEIKEHREASAPAIAASIESAKVAKRLDKRQAKIGREVHELFSGKAPPFGVRKARAAAERRGRR